MVNAWRALGWSVLLGFAAGAVPYVISAVVTALWGPVYYNFSFIDYVGRFLLYGVAGSIIFGATFFVSYLVWLRSRPAATAIRALALVTISVQVLELGAIEAFAIREPNSLAWPLSEQLTPLNVSIFREVGNWEGRPDAAFFWFSAAVVAFVYAGLARRLFR